MQQGWMPGCHLAAGLLGGNLAGNLRVDVSSLGGFWACRWVGGLDVGMERVLGGHL
jgi:hypothetical protein